MVDSWSAPANPVALLSAGVDAVLAVDPVGDVACGELLLGVMAQRNRLDAALCRLVARGQALGTAQADGSMSMRAWLGFRARLDSGEARALVSCAAGLTELPEAAKAFEAGEIGLRHAGPMAGLLVDVPAEAVRAFESGLVDVARTHPPVMVRQLARKVREAEFPDGTAEARRRLVDGRYVAISEGYGGGFDLTGRLTPEAAAGLQAALAPLLTPCGPSDARTAGQRRHDALVEVAKAAMAAGGLPASGGDRPRLLVTVDWPTLAGHATGDGGPLTDGPDKGLAWRATGGYRSPSGDPRLSVEGRGAELVWAGPIDLDTLRRLACDAEISRIVFGPRSEVLDLGRSARLPTAAQRRALIARDGGCVFPGCTRPPAWCEAHHLLHWIRGGRTDLANLCLLCAFHHHLLHEEKWDLRPDGDGGWTATAPDGRVFHRRKRGA